MLAQDTQCVQSLCTARYDALYVQRYRQTTGKCHVTQTHLLAGLGFFDENCAIYLFTDLRYDLTI